MENKFIIAAAGAGKITYLVDQALLCKDNVLITTYTDENEDNIKCKFIEKYGCVPKHVTIMTWFSFLIKHGVKPYQGCYDDLLYNERINGLIFVQGGISQRCSEKKDFMKFYFNNNKIYSDKLSNFVVKVNKKSDGCVIDRISKIFPYIFIDEVQDLCGYDLDFIKLLLTSTIKVVLVGDPRQCTYKTHWEKKNKQYQKDEIKDYFLKECKGIIEINEDILNVSHRNNKEICEFSSKLYPNYASVEPCKCDNCHPHKEDEGIFIVKEDDLFAYMDKYNPIQLRYDKRTKNIVDGYLCLNMGESKGKTFDRVVIFPTKGMKDWLFDGAELEISTKAKLYVAITRAKYSVAFVVPENEMREIKGKDINVWRC